MLRSLGILPSVKNDQNFFFEKNFKNYFGKKKKGGHRIVVCNMLSKYTKKTCLTCFLQPGTGPCNQQLCTETSPCNWTASRNMMHFCNQILLLLLHTGLGFRVWCYNTRTTTQFHMSDLCIMNHVLSIVIVSSP
jgi:hypothetical protein